MAPTKGQIAVAAVGIGGASTFLTVVAYQNRLISLPQSLANLLGIPATAPTPDEIEEEETVAEFKDQASCEAAGFDWWADKQACTVVRRPLIGKSNFDYKGPPRNTVTWTLEVPLFVTMLTYRFKAGGIWTLAKKIKINISYRDLAGKWHSLGSSSNVKFGEVSQDMSKAIGAKITKIKFDVEAPVWDDIDSVFATLI